MNVKELGTQTQFAPGGHRIIRVILTLAITLATAVAGDRKCRGESGFGPPPAKKLIEVGWDIPAPSYVATHIRQMEARPFDGVIMRMAPIADVFATRCVDEKALQVDMEAMKGIEWRTFTDNFLILYARSEMDWFSDADWEWVLRNAGLAAKAARVGRCKGLVFDCEPYGKDPWDYKKQQHAATRSFREYQDIVRKRGAQFLARIQDEFPDPVIHTFYLLGFYTHANRGALALEPDPVKREQRLQAHQWALYTAFVAGMLDAAGSKTVFTDGNEDAYWYKNAGEYFESYHAIRQTAANLLPPALQSPYKAHVQCAQSVYVDYLYGLEGQPKSDLSEEARLKWFEHNVYYALKASDCYAWLYSEKIDWWQNRWGKLPPGIEDAIRRARGKLARGEPLGFSR